MYLIQLGHLGNITWKGVLAQLWCKHNDIL